MAIIAVQRDRPKEEGPNKTDVLLDRISKGLGIVSNIYGIKTAQEQSELRKYELEQAKTQQSQQAKDKEFKTAGLTSQQDFLDKNIEVDPDQFKQKYGTAFPVTEYKIPVGDNLEDVRIVYGVPIKSFESISQEKLKQQELAFKQQEAAKKVEQIAEKKDTLGTQKTDEAFARDYTTYVSEGTEAKTFDSINKLDALIDDAEKNLSEGWDERLMGAMPEWYRDLVDPEDKAIEDRLKAVAQKSLKETLGTQFTAKEGEQLLNRAYNPTQSKQENLRRMRELANSIRQQATAKKSAMDYFAEKGTIKGFKAPMTQQINIAGQSQRPTQEAKPTTLYGGFTAPSARPVLMPESDDEFIQRYLNK